MPGACPQIDLTGRLQEEICGRSAAARALVWGPQAQQTVLSIGRSTQGHDWVLI